MRLTNPRDHYDVIQLRYHLALRASAGYKDSIRRFHIYQNSSADTDRTTWFESLRSTSDHLFKHLGVFSDHLDAAYADVVQFNNDIEILEDLNAVEGDTVGLQWPGREVSRTLPSRFAWLIPSFINPRSNYQLFLEALQITCNSCQHYLQGQRGLLNQLRGSVKVQMTCFANILLNYEIQYKENDLIQLNALTEKALIDLKILMKDMNGNPDMVDTMANAET